MLLQRFFSHFISSRNTVKNCKMDLRFVFIVFLLKWTYAQGSHPPRIVEHPIDTTVPRHEPATLNCKAEGSPTPTIQWYKDGVPLKILPGSHRITLPAGGLFFLKVVNSRRETDAGIYWCEAKNELGVARSRNATLQVAVLRDEFRLEPQNTRIAQGDTALLECAAPRGIPEPTVTWKKGGQKLDLEGTKRIRIVDGGNLAIQDARQSDEGQYQCIAKNPVGVRESSLATLKVHVKPYIIRGPHDQTVLEGASVTFPCRVGGDPMPDVLWLRTASGGNMPLDRVSVLEDRSLRLERVTIADEGEYSCEADNVVGAITAMGTLTVFVPEAPPFGMEAIQFNRTSVFLKWLAPQPNRTRNGILTSYNVLVKGLDVHNTTRIFKNMTIDAATPTLLLANLTTGVTYYIAVAAATRVGVGPYSKPAVLRIDARTQSLDTGYTRYPISRDIADDFLTQTWFIVLLGSIIAIIVFLLGALVLFKRYQFIKQTSLGSLHGNHAIGTVRKFPTLPMNGGIGGGGGSGNNGGNSGIGGSNGLWIDPSGGVWRQAAGSCTTKEQLPGYAQATAQQRSTQQQQQGQQGQHGQRQQQGQSNTQQPLPDYERLSPLNMPDYAEVACSTFKGPHNNAAQTSGVQAGSSSLYDSCGAYATTNVVANVKLYQNRYGAKPAGVAAGAATAAGNNNNGCNNDYQSTGMYSAPASAHYGCLEPNPMTISTASTAILSGSPAKLKKINITENKMEHMQNLNSNKNETKLERTNPFNQQQQLLLASNALKQGLGAYANTTLAAQMASGGGAGTLRRQRQPKTLFKSETNILGKSSGVVSRHQSNGSSANGNLDFLTGGPPAVGGESHDADFEALCNSTNQLLNDWASSASIAAGDYHFGSKQPSKQHLYVKAKDGTWSAVSSDAYQTFKQQQQQQQQFHAGSGDNKMPLLVAGSVNPAHSSSSLAADSKFLSSFGTSANV
ncbi:uncharacterized protein robo3 isoform X2 [Drosophila virilis]|uniref:uncharacterized protein robo3 isoform X2 n=1 Tax=Drosophila virilis TaxID=7244 RepID=UPI0013963C5D|nr:uncharacterized protein LOC6627618 isoform X2 [Drosophila virilis]